MSPDKLKKEIQDGTFKPKAALAALAAAREHAETPRPEIRYVAVQVRLILPEKTLDALNDWCKFEHQKPETVISRRFSEGFWEYINEGRKELGLPRVGPMVELEKLIREVRAQFVADGKTIKDADSEILAALENGVADAESEQQRKPITPLVGLPITDTDETD